ncbi:hypothetical protein ABZ901_17565 [Actinacidiphila alni]|uniref:hypothetical protein n=1 Tax=Actinacidiphila alni TaxID=380248 RepID=UPI0033E4DB55
MNATPEEIPQDLAKLEELLLRGASTVRQVEAAERLVLRVSGLRDWLIANHFVRKYNDDSGVFAATDFESAYRYANELKRTGGDGALSESGLNESHYSVLGVAANLSGKIANSLRYAVHNIDEEDAQLVAESLLYAFGYMDAVVDVTGNETDGIGPNAIEYDRRTLEL